MHDESRGEGSAIRARPTHGRGHKLEPGKCQWRGEHRAGDGSRYEVAERPENRPGSADAGNLEQEQDGHEPQQSEDEHGQRVDFTGVNSQRQGDRQHYYAGYAVPALHDEEDGGENPAQPRHDARYRPSKPGHERSAQLEGGGGEHGAQDPDPHDAAEGVDAGPGDDRRKHDLDRVRQPQREEVANRRRKAECGRLPVERQWHSQSAVGIPER